MQLLIDEHVAAFAKRTKRPQINVALWHNNVVYESSFGISKSEAVDVFEIGSIGKTFTATLLAILVEKRVINLNDRIGKYHPNLPLLKDVTFKQLVTHTSGLPAEPIDSICFSHSALISKLLEFQDEDIPRFLGNIKKPLQPGKFLYSNLAMALLGNTLAQCLGMSYEHAVKSHLLTPLGMVDTHISEKNYASTRLASGHNASGKIVPHFKWQGMEPAGVWRSTCQDMITYLKAHLGHAGEDWQHQLQITTSPVYADPKLSHIGYAWVLEQRKELGLLAWHNGGTFGQHAVIMSAKERNMGIVILSNQSPRLWHGFFASYSLEALAVRILKALV
ncbi:hypothetical protein PA25_12570 [Pseudoalteromonas sp. A25]|uniref:serine hydrolase domain-containing protein n=1 Tax=Pseudoalteromonas sp. A25 TaxID=116092 RepID=UPI0012607FD2|nr:serine hydrolase domain-containing protein [Pseudoalteromonas sp. A25]BBN81272.1 hypothetical protein PA25_12570 [Pseudoalteromonas sp. A25]